MIPASRAAAFSRFDTILSVKGSPGLCSKSHTFGNDNDIRLSLSKEENVLLVGGRAYLPAEDFVLAEFFDRYVKMAFIDYSAIKETAPRKEEDKRPPLPEGYLEKLQQVRYSDHTVRVYTSYFRDFQQHFEGRKIETVTPGEINDYLLYLIHEKNISSCQQNQRINAIKFYYEKVLGQERRCYKVNRAKREKTLPDVLSKEEIKKILDATVTDLRFFCMFSILYSAGLRISELLELKPGDINESRSLIRVRQGKGKKDRYTLLSKPLMKKLTEYNRLYKPKVTSTNSLPFLITGESLILFFGVYISMPHVLSDIETRFRKFIKKHGLSMRFIDI